MDDEDVARRATNTWERRSACQTGARLTCLLKHYEQCHGVRDPDRDTWPAKRLQNTSYHYFNKLVVSPWTSCQGRATGLNSMHAPKSLITGIEPNRELHMKLQASARRAGLKGIYEVVGCGVEEILAKRRLGESEVNTITTTQCLCSVPLPQRVISELYVLLEPGGQWLVYEHVRTKYAYQLSPTGSVSVPAPVYEWFTENASGILNLVWPHFLSGCELCRPTDAWLFRAGPWKETDLHPLPGEGPYNTIPFILGSLTK